MHPCDGAELQKTDFLLWNKEAVNSTHPKTCPLIGLFRLHLIITWVLRFSSAAVAPDVNSLFTVGVVVLAVDLIVAEKSWGEGSARIGLTFTCGTWCSYCCSCNRWFSCGISCIKISTKKNKGRMAAPNRMNYRENSKQPSTPALSFGKLYCNFF